MPNNKLLIIGPLPSSAGIGGVTIHIDRLLRSLSKEGFNYAFCDYKTETLGTIVRSIINAKVVHLHPSNPLLRFFLVSLCRLLGKRVVFTIHGDLGRFSSFKNYLDKLSVKWSNLPIAINIGSYNKARSWNMNAILMSAYIPPYEDGYLPDSVYRRIQEAKDKNLILVSTNASARAFTELGYEIYGIDFLIKFFEKRPQYFLLVSDPSGQYANKYSKCLNNVVFITGAHSFYALMKVSDIAVRSTATDGDSLSVREGLDLGIKVIATDCVARPKGVILFKYNDEESFEKALMSSVPTDAEENIDVVSELIDIYKELI